jgi:putative DNA methylase
MNNIPKRLIEVDLPIKRISAHARREKSIRHGHISTMHIWWARRPLAACRAVICASLWPDPADEYCPKVFLEAAKNHMLSWSSLERQNLLSADSRGRFEAARKNSSHFDDPIELRKALLDFIADFSNWDNSIIPEFLDTSRALTQISHEALSGSSGSRPLVMDPFAGGGSIPLEALRVGADAYASDLNPIPVLLNKVMLEYVPKYGQRLVDEVQKWGDWINAEAQKELSEYYPKDKDGGVPIAYLWARTIRCEGPGCGAEVPLLRSLWLLQKGKNSAALRVIAHARAKRIDFEIIEGAKASEVGEGTVQRSSAVCPCCGYATPAENVRRQFISRDGGADDARLVAVVILSSKKRSTSFRTAKECDTTAFVKATAALKKMTRFNKSPLVPNEPLPYLRSIFNVNLLGINEWGKLFNRRQALALVTLVDKSRHAMHQLDSEGDAQFATAVGTCLAFAIDRCADYWSSLAVWAGEFVAHTFGRQALGIIWDYAEVCGFSGGSGNYDGAIEWILRCIKRESLPTSALGTVECCSACNHPLPSDSADAFITDPPYYDAVPYADLSDYFYVWLKRSVGDRYPNLFSSPLSQKKGEVVQLAERNPAYSYKTRDYFESLMKDALVEGRRILKPAGVCIVVFAHKTTAGWETQLSALIEAGWIVTCSWPIDTERPGRLRANNAAALASSVHLVCRPRENPDGSVCNDEIGDWREVLSELPKRIHAWMPRLADEGVVGADAIFACLGPALEIFSRYSRVEKASGEAVTLKEYLEQVWAAVSKEALNMIFSGADAAGFEEDARLTAMWLWTLATGEQGSEARKQKADESDYEEVTEKGKKTKGGFSLEYDAARKIAQGLGVHLEGLDNLVEVKGETAVLLPVAARTKYLFGKDSAGTPRGLPKKKDRQLTLNFEEELKQAEEETDNWRGEFKSRAGKTILDQVHQCMILFAAGRGEAMKRFLVEDGVGRSGLFWKLAQALSALYPTGTDEKRWVDGVLARKKGLGF